MLPMLMADDLQGVQGSKGKKKIPERWWQARYELATAVQLISQLVKCVCVCVCKGEL